MTTEFDDFLKETMNYIKTELEAELDSRALIEYKQRNTMKQLEQCDTSNVIVFPIKDTPNTKQ